MNTRASDPRLVFGQILSDDHGVIKRLLRLLLLLLLQLPCIRAQNAAGKPLQPEAPPEPTTEFNPKMAIIMIVLVSVFFFLGFFSVYIRHFAERALGINRDSELDPATGRWRPLRAQRGLDRAVIDSFPTFVYSAVKGLKIGKGSLECAVCLNEFLDHETLRLIPKCSHVFHPDCINSWLVSHSTCPLCRASLVPRPGETFSALIPDASAEPENSSTETPDVEGGTNSPNQRMVLPSPDVNLINSMAATSDSRPRRSRSTGWRLAGLFPRSPLAGTSLVQSVENFDRFTLKLPEGVWGQLALSPLNPKKYQVALPEARSSRRGYLSGGERSYFYYNRFDRHGRSSERRPFSMTPPFSSRGQGSVRSPGPGGGGEGQASCGTPPKGLFQAIKLPLDRLFLGKDNVGERSSDRLRGDDQA